MPAKVRLFSFSLAWLSLALAITLTAGCRSRSASEPEEGEEQNTVSSRFGDPYQIVTNFAPADPDFMPQLVEDTLVAKITYTGGCRDHDFNLRDEIERDTAKLWLRHSAHGDDCEALVQDEVRVKVPSNVMKAPVIALLPPEGGPPIIVKWGD